ncbi:MAG TPA: hypothetical protein VHO72_13805 [Bacteroidales bacterium]|nr:hypothetical protein [Bacteroidales bacterium]
MNKLLLAFTCVAAGCFYSCSSGPKETNNNNDSASANTILSDSVKIVDGSIPIFYNMYLSVEMSSLFQAIGASYDEKLLNSPDRIHAYETSTDKALNLGVYAVDLSYAKYFEQFEQAGRYLKNMNKLSTELGIPNDKFMVSLKRIETNLTNKDSLVLIANQMYKNTEEHLKANNRASAASLIIAGGWTEAMYIAVQLANTQNSDIQLIERIVEQKTSIDNLLSLLEKYKNEPIIKDLIVKFTDVRSSLKDLSLDEKDMGSTYKQLDELKMKLSSLRKSMIS